MGATLAELAERFHCRVRGNPDLTIHGVASIETAGVDKIAFVSNSAALTRHANTRAGALILAESLAEHYDGNALTTENPFMREDVFASFRVFHDQGIFL